MGGVALTFSVYGSRGMGVGRERIRAVSVVVGPCLGQRCSYVNEGSLLSVV